MPTLPGLGVQVTRTFHTAIATLEQRLESLDRYDGEGASGTKTTRLELTLPSACAVTAGFCREGLRHKLIKVFKKELQAGEATFDAAVYITTDTADATAAWLASPAVRADLLAWIEGHGTIEVAGTTVVAEFESHTKDVPPELVRLIESLLSA